MILSQSTRQLLFPVKSRAHSLWPDAKTFQLNGSSYCLVPHGPREYIALQAAGYTHVPSPLLTYYDWNGGHPFAVQRKTCELMTGQKRCYVLNDLGTGKTRAALWSWDFLNKQGCAGKLLVVCPLSTMKFVWQRECKIAVPGRKVAILYGTKAQRLKALKSDADIFIINHDGLGTIVNQLYARTDIDTLVLDELAVYRNTSERYKKMRVFAQRFEWVWGMTGRPMPNSPLDVYCQAKIITPHTVPQFRSYAQTALMFKVNDFLWVPKSDALETAFSWLQPAVRYTLDDVVELPESIFRTVNVELSAEQKKVYGKMAAELAVMVREKLITAANSAVAMGKLLQVGGGYVYTHNPEYVTLDSEPRQQKLLELLEEAAHKVIVFLPYRHLIDNISKFLTDNKVTHAVVHGDISATKRNDIFYEFQSGQDVRVLLSHPGCISHGLTLTAADTIIWYTPITSLETYEQCNARIRRVGTTHKQLYLHLHATPVETRIYKMLRNKQITQDKFLELIEQATELDDVESEENGNGH